MSANTNRADVLLLLVTIIAASGWIITKEALAEMQPLLFLGSRFFLAGVILLLMSRLAWHHLKNAKSAVCIVLLGLLMAAALLCWLYGISHSQHLGEGAFINSLGIVFIPIIARVLFAEPVSFSNWFSLPVAIIGLAFLSLNSGFSLHLSQIYFLCSSVLLALHFTLVARLVSSIPAVFLTAMQLIVVGLAGLLVSFFVESWQQPISTAVLGWFIASILIGTCLRFSLQTYAQGLAPAGSVALIMILEPVWAAIMASFWFDEQMTFSQALGCLLIFGSMLISRWRWCRQLLLFLMSKRQKVK